MNDHVLQGVACEFEQPFIHDNDVWLLKSGCFDKSLRESEPDLLMDHDPEQRLGTPMVYAGEKSLVFRFPLAGSMFKDIADEYESYLAVSVGHFVKHAHITTIEGVQIVTVTESSLREISLLDRVPAIKSTYARVASWDRCSGLEADYKSGSFDRVGSVISLHRKVKAADNAGVVKYANSLTDWERKADRFTSLLKRLQ